MKKYFLYPLVLGLLLTCCTMQAMKRTNLDEQLFDAAKQGNAKRIKALVKQGANLTVYDDEGYTPLHIAVEFSQGTAVKVLLAAGADPNRETSGIYYEHELTSFDLIESQNIELVFKAYEEATDILPEEVRHIMPGVIAIKKSGGKDVSIIIGSKLIKILVDQKLKKADFPNFEGSKLQQIIRQNVVKAIMYLL